MSRDPRAQSSALTRPGRLILFLDAGLERIYSLLVHSGKAMRDVAGGLILVMAFLITFEVIVRRLAGFSVAGVTALSGYLLAVCLTWAMVHALLSGGHIRVDIVVAKTPLRVRQYLHVMAVAALTTFVFALTRRAWDVVAASWNFGSIDATAFKLPLIVPQGLWAIGLTVFCVAAAVSTVRAALFILAGDAQAVDALLRARGLGAEPGKAESADASGEGL